MKNTKNVGDYMEGFIKDWRQELESDIWVMPPLYHRIWQWLKYMANHQDGYVPMHDGSRVLVKRGQRLTSIRKIAEAVGWYERGIFKKPNPKTVQSVLDWLVVNKMITIETGNRKYTVVTIVNYDIYQAKGDSESNSLETASIQSMDINKNDKNVKNEKELVNDPFSRELLNILKNIKNYPLDIGADTGFIQQLLIDYPALDIKEELKKWAIYKLDKPLTGKSNPRSQFRNWCKKAAEWQKERTPKQQWDSNNRAYQPWEPPED